MSVSFKGSNDFKSRACARDVRTLIFTSVLHMCMEGADYGRPSEPEVIESQGIWWSAGE